MKKIVGRVLIQLLIAIALASCASMPREPISEGNLSDLRGEWKGSRTVRQGTFRTEMEIYNESLPLKGKFIFHEVKRKTGGTYTLEFMQGMIKESNLYVTRGQNYFELSLHKGDGKMKLEGDFFAEGIEGTITLYKK
jgi:hypothetical protein